LCLMPFSRDRIPLFESGNHWLSLFDGMLTSTLSFPQFWG
jgi:hypothetical protein